MDVEPTIIFLYNSNVGNRDMAKSLGMDIIRLNNYIRTLIEERKVRYRGAR